MEWDQWLINRYLHDQRYALQESAPGQRKKRMKIEFSSNGNRKVRWYTDKKAVEGETPKATKTQHHESIRWSLDRDTVASEDPRRVTVMVMVVEEQNEGNKQVDPEEEL